MIAMSPGPPPYENENEPMVEGGGCNLKRVEVRVVKVVSFFFVFLCSSVSLVILDVFFFQCDQCTNYGFLHVCEGCFLLRCWLALFCSTFRL